MPFDVPSKVIGLRPLLALRDIQYVVLHRLRFQCLSSDTGQSDTKIRDVSKLGHYYSLLRELFPGPRI
jgi:hypothetical protein